MKNVHQRAVLSHVSQLLCCYCCRFLFGKFVCLVVMTLPLPSLQEDSLGEDRSVVMINDREQCPKSLKEMVEIMKKDVSMDIGLQTSKDGIHQCALSLCLPNNNNNNSKANNSGSARRERLREAATMSSACWERNHTTTHFPRVGCSITIIVLGSVRTGNHWSMLLRPILVC